MGKKKELSHKKVDDLSELLAQTTTSGIPPMEAATSQTDTQMSGADSGSKPVQQLHSSEQQLSRRELQSRLKAKLAGINLDRTAGLEKGIGDSRGLKKRPPRRGKMNIGCMNNVRPVLSFCGTVHGMHLHAPHRGMSRAPLGSGGVTLLAPSSRASCLSFLFLVDK